MATISDTITTALRELGIVGVSTTPPAELSVLGLSLVNRVLDRWNADYGTLYADAHSSLTALTANLNPHTIGPSGATFTATTNRPVVIEGIRLTSDNGETYRRPLDQHGPEWWHGLGSPGTTAEFPTDFYYTPTQANGSIYFYPEPSSASVKAQIWSRVVFAQVTLVTDVSLPPGYLDALTETLKERLTELPMFASMSSAVIKDAARVARAIAFGTNVRVPPLCTADAGMGSGSRTYDYTLGPYSLMRGSR